MKKVTSTVLFAFILYSTASAQWVTSGNNISNTNSGNVGIGTTSPTSNLHIGNAHGSGITLGYDSGNNYRAQIVPYWNSNIDSRIDFNINRSYGTPLTTIMSVGYDGNVGIGTIVPDEKLTVLGKIHSREVKVDLNIPAPDYVFRRDYRLRTLNELEDYIGQNQHLPEILSAAEIKERGIELGEMNMKLLQKIEELTLYMIQHDKMIEKQSAQISALIKDNKKFKNEIEKLKADQ